MKKTMVVVFLAVCFSGCGFMKGMEASINRDKLDKIDAGMTKDQVRAVMGKPYKREFSEEREVWFYITEWQADGYTTLDEMTPFVFKDGELIGWGSNFIHEDLKKYELRVR